MRILPVNRLSHAAMRPYGIIIDSKPLKDNGKGNAFGVVLTEKSKGWRIGYLVLREKEIPYLENHPDSLETFEPVSGTSIIAFAPEGKPDKIKLFLLDQPVVVRKGVWHNVATISKRAEIKIFENSELKTEYYNFNKPVRLLNKTEAVFRAEK